MSLGLLAAAAFAVAGPQSEVVPPDNCPNVPVGEIAFRAGTFEAWIVGSGDVRAGTSEVSWTAGGCALLEKWVGAVSGDGTALYLHHSGRWHLLFVNNQGRSLSLSGQPDGRGGILFQGRHPDLDGRVGDHRMQLSPDGEDVRQTWHFRPAGSRKWELLVDMIQRRQRRAG